MRMEQKQRRIGFRAIFLFASASTNVENKHNLVENTNSSLVNLYGTFSIKYYMYAMYRFYQIRKIEMNSIRFLNQILCIKKLNSTHKCILYKKIYYQLMRQHSLSPKNLSSNQSVFTFFIHAQMKKNSYILRITFTKDRRTNRTLFHFLIHL